MEGDKICFFGSSLIYQAVPIIRFYKRDNKMVPSEMNREMANHRPNSDTGPHLAEKAKFPFIGFKSLNR